MEILLSHFLKFDCSLLKLSSNNVPDNFKRHLFSKKNHMPELARNKEALLQYKRQCEEEDRVLQRVERADGTVQAVKITDAEKELTNCKF